MKYLKSLVLIFLISFYSCNNNEDKAEQFLEDYKNQQKITYEKPINHYTNLLNEKDKLADTALGRIYCEKGFCESQIEAYNISNQDLFKSLEYRHNIKFTLYILAGNFSGMRYDTLALRCYKEVLKYDTTDPYNVKPTIERLNRLIQNEEKYINSGLSKEEAFYKAWNDQFKLELNL